MNTHATRHSQAGAALAIALLILVIITLLGVAAVRATQVELKLSQNAESHMSATQAAESMVAYATTATPLPVNGDLTFSSCKLPSNVTTALFTCTSPATTIDTATATVPLRTSGYALIQREEPLFVEVSVLRDAQLSAKNYDFARFTVTGGYDRSGDGMSAAEVTEGVLKLHTKVAGVTYE